MTKDNKHIADRRLLSSYVSSVISISLVLLLVGTAVLLLVNAKGVADCFRENMRIAVMLRPDVEESLAVDFCGELEELPFVREAMYISPEQGAMEMADQLGEDFLSVFDSSPIPPSIELSLHASHVSSDSIAVVVEKISSYGIVEETVYQESLVDALNSNMARISALLLVFIILLLFISSVLINNTVRLNVFARRFSIHTMKLVGATRRFIRHPFMVQAVFQGMFASTFAVAAILGGMFALKSSFAELFTIFTMPMFLSVVATIYVVGLLLCLVSTWLAVGRVVSFSRDELYV